MRIELQGAGAATEKATFMLIIDKSVLQQITFQTIWCWQEVRGEKLN